MLNSAIALAVEKADIFDLGERYFQTVGNEESIPLGIITALTQDKQGFIWIGTQKGIVRFDGYQYRHFKFDVKNTHSLVDDFINVLWTAPDGKLWIGTWHSGISVFDPVSETFERFTINSQVNPISSNSISAITGDKQGNVWIGTQKGIDKFNTKTNEMLHFDENLLTSNHIKSLLIDDQNNLWIGTAMGLSKRWSDGKQLLSISSDSNNNRTHFKGDKKNILYGRSISKLLLAKDGKIWIGTEETGAGWLDVKGRLHQIDHHNNKKSLLSNTSIRDIAQPNEQEIWFATYGHGIFVVDSQSGDVISNIRHDASLQTTINLDTLGALMVDDSGLLWIGTWGGGLNKYNPNNKAFRSLRHSPNNKKGLSYSDTISILETSNGDIWIGTRGNGIDIIRPGVGKIRDIRVHSDQPSALQNGNITAMIESSTGVIWLGSRSSGLYQYRQETDDFLRYHKKNGLSSNYIKALHEGTNGEIWIGTGSGLDRLDPESGKVKYLVTKNSLHPTLQNRINRIVQRKDGTIYAGGTNGLYKLAPNDNFLTLATHDSSIKDSLSHNTVLGLYLDKQETLWVSTQQGLDKLIKWTKKGPLFDSINRIVGSPNQALWANLIQDKQGRFWDGQSIINLKTHQRRVLTKADGVDFGVNWTGGYTKTNSGTLLYTGSKGLLMIKPQHFKEWVYQPPLVITQLMINGIARPVGHLHHLKISSKIKSFSLEFSALDYSEPSKNQYAYQLEGYDQNWIPTSFENRIANYTNLSPGKYLLRIKATNRLGSWSSHRINLPITILPQWYQMIWAKLLLSLVICGVLYLIFYFRIYQLQRNKEELRKQVELQTKQLKLSNQSIRTLSDIGHKISSTLDLDKILNTVYFHVNQMMDASIFSIGFYNPKEQSILFKLIIERGKKCPPFSILMDEKQRLAVYCIENKVPVIINNFERDQPKYLPNNINIIPRETTEPASLLYWPLIVRGEPIGVISVQSFKEEAYNQQHQEIIETFAATASIALDNANAYIEARQLSEAKGNFLANMSHEIRTPMHGILGMSKLMNKTNLTPEQKEYSDNIAISANILLTVINDILDFSKIEAGKMPLEERPFGLSRLIHNVYSVMNVIAEEKGIEFDYTISPDTVGDFVGDAARINQILLNLCSNAIKFTEKGKVLIDIKTIEFDSFKYTLQINVTDQGIGITKDALSTIFQSFAQANTSTARKFGGTGLGLAISRLLAREMLGDITVTSEPGIGSCFTMTLKLSIYKPNSNNRFEELNKKTALQVLLLESDKDLTRKTNIFLSEQGVQTTIADPNDINQLARFSTGFFDFSLLGWDVKNDNNQEILAILNNKLHIPSNRIIIYSEKRPALIERSAATKGENILQKPLSMLEVKQTLLDNIEKPDEPLHLPLESLNILVAEDNKINQLIARKLIIAKGAMITVVENGKDAVEKFHQNSYDAILMDIQMPEMDGTVATEIIRRSPSGKNIPIIAMTANVLQEDIDYYKTHGFNEHVSKPINTQDLISKILKHLPKTE